ncbi:MAG: two-component regulator propeller domain-containing protein, partial [Acidobacteriota bacterium]|nr:two-component regulator propeller domain-containing protein [Acidobacteriota bacterium]
MNRLRIVLPAVLFFLLGLFRAPLAGQSYLIRTYTENDGLASSTIHDLAQTPDGRIWFATRAGVSVYDGTRWTTYSAPNGFPTLTINELAVDANGSLWAWGDNPHPTLARFRDGKWEPQTAPMESEAALYPAGFVVTGPPGRETAVLGTQFTGVFLYRNGAWSRLRKADGLASDGVHGLAADGETIYAATNGGLSIIRDGAVDNSLNAAHPILRQGIVGIVAEKTTAGRRLWLAGRSWLARWEGGKLQVLSENLITYTDITHPHLAMSPDGTGGVYFGNPNAVFHWRAANREVESLDRSSGLIAEGMTAVLLDREMNIWIASLRGLSKISGQRFANFRKVQGLLEDEVTAILQLKDGRLVFGHNIGLTFFDGRSFRTLSFANRSKAQLTENRILDMIEDADGVIWAAASNSGLARISPDGAIRWFGREAGLIGQVSSVADAGNGRLWVSSNQGLLLYAGGKFEPAPDASLANRYIRKIGRTRDGRIFITSASGGVSVKERGVWTRFSSSDNPSANNGYAAADDGRGHLLVGTLAGLYEAKEGRLLPFALPGLHIERPVYLILREPGGALWFGTDNGAVRWDGQAARAYTIKQGFAGLEVNRAAGLVDGSGRVWIGTSAGVSRYQPEFDFAPDRIPPPIVSIERIEAGGAWNAADKPLHLAARQNNLEFEFRAVTFVDEAAVRYRYRMEGYDSRWSDPRTAGEG